MTMMDTAITVLVITLIFIIIYTKMQNQRLTDTLNELKEILQGQKNK